MTDKRIDPKWYREVLGQYPTGVCVITGIDAGGFPLGMTIGSFTSVSLEPPLVAFMPASSAATWQKLSKSKSFCVNILSAEQEDVCRIFASRMEHKFKRVQYSASPSGLPILDGCIAWIECDFHEISQAGDHHVVLGLVREMRNQKAGLPLLFFRGGYGGFSPHSLAVPDPANVMSRQLRIVDIARPEMEELAADSGCRCIATIRAQDAVLIAASAGNPKRGRLSTLVGQQLPDIPPTGSVFAAWLGEEALDEWLLGSAPDASALAHKASLELVRRRGYSIGLLSDAQRKIDHFLNAVAAGSKNVPTINVRDLTAQLNFDPPDLDDETLRKVFWISAPVFDRDGKVVMALTLNDLPFLQDVALVRRCIDSLVASTDHVSRKLKRIQ
jgi:flavin reductase (DIM6/NTAB) family NADH-FMN oxidoreductase RutF/DNA-binding IclR family transcriptional regulator